MGWMGPPTIEVVVLNVVVMLVRDTVLLVKVVEAAPSDTCWLSTVESIFVVDEFVGGFMLMGDIVLLVVEVEVETSEILDAGWLVAMVKLLGDGEVFEDIMLLGEEVLLVVVEEVEGDNSEPSDASWLVSTIESVVDAAVFVVVIVGVALDVESDEVIEVAEAELDEFVELVELVLLVTLVKLVESSATLMFVLEGATSDATTC